MSSRAHQSAYSILPDGVREPEALPPGQVMMATPHSQARAPAEAYGITAAAPVAESDLPPGQVTMPPHHG